MRRLLAYAAATTLLLGAAIAFRSSQSGASDQARTVRVAADTQQVVLAVKGMSCESCERTITVMLAHTPGVIRSTVSLARGDAVILYDASRTTPAQLITAIERLGYSAIIKKT